MYIYFATAIIRQTVKFEANFCSKHYFCIFCCSDLFAYSDVFVSCFKRMHIVHCCWSNFLKNSVKMIDVEKYLKFLFLYVCDLEKVYILSYCKTKTTIISLIWFYRFINEVLTAYENYMEFNGIIRNMITCIKILCERENSRYVIFKNKLGI